jgi:hypothetical protein
MPSVAPRDHWWHQPLLKGLASLLFALSVTFFPFAADAIRARRRAKPIEIVASAEPASQFSSEARSEIATRAEESAESIAVTVVITNTGGDSVRTTVSQYCPAVFQLRHVADGDGRGGMPHPRSSSWTERR